MDAATGGRYCGVGNPSPPPPSAMPPSSTTSDPELALLVERTEGLQPWRRVFHAANGVFIAVALLFVLPSREAALLAAGSLLAVLLLLDLVRLRDPRANALFFRVFRVFASPREVGRPASSTWYVVGILLALLFFPLSAVIPGVLVLAFADPAASVVGRRWGRRPLGKGSVEGSAVFAVVALLVLLPLVPVHVAIAGALLAAVVEILPLGLDDNLTIPLTVGLVVFLMG